MTELATVEAPPGELTVLERAMASGATPEALEKLIGLMERMQANKGKALYATAMNACQAEMPAIIKTASNPHTRSKYVRLEDLTAAIKPVYTRHGFSLSFGEEDCPRENWIRCTCLVRHAAGHVETFRADFPLDGIGSQGGKSSMNPVQSVGSTRSYARRYMQYGIFDLVVAGEDTDAANYGHREPEADDAPQGQPARMGNINDAERARMEAEVASWDEPLDEIEQQSDDPEDLNVLLPRFQQMRKDPVLKLGENRVWKKIMAVAKAKGWLFDRHALKFHAAKEAVA